MILVFKHYLLYQLFKIPGKIIKTIHSYFPLINSLLKRIHSFKLDFNELKT